MVATMAADPNRDPQAAKQAEQGVDAPDLRWFVFALFFIFGGITSLNDVIIPKLKELFTLSYGEALLVQSAFFFAYFVFSIPGRRDRAQGGLYAHRLDRAAGDDGGLPDVRAGLGLGARSRSSCSRCSCWRRASPSSRSSPTR